MDSIELTGLLVIFLFLILMFLRLPLGICMLLCGFIGMWIIRGMPAALTGISIFTFKAASSYNLSVIPLFIFMGLLAGASGISKNAFTSLEKWLGHLPGGLAIATTGACSAFGAVCGSNTAAAATMCSVALPEMRRYGYADTLSLGCIAAGGNLGILIPPSTAFVLYGFITETSIGSLFIAGILPGILLTLMFWALIYVQCNLLNPSLAPKKSSASWRERLVAIPGLAGILLVFIIVMGGIYGGIFTPTEASAVGVATVLLIGIISRQLTWRGFIKCLQETGRVTAMIMFLIIGAMLFSSFMTATEIPILLANSIEGLTVNRYIILAAILIIYIICGFFLEIFAILLITLPIFFPILMNLGFDPIHFGVLSVLTVMIGCITPPFGIVVFALYGLINRSVPLFTIFRGCYPFLLVMIVCIILLVVFPEISLFLPYLGKP